MGSCSSRPNSAHPDVEPKEAPVAPRHLDPWAPFALSRKIRPLERWPDGTLFEPWAPDETPDDMLELLRGRPVPLGPLFAGKRTVLVGMPGAYTPNCSRVHLPQYVKHAPEFYAAGVDQIIVMVANDTCVVRSWSEENRAQAARVRIMTDRNCDVAMVRGPR